MFALMFPKSPQKAATRGNFWLYSWFRLGPVSSFLFIDKIPPMPAQSHILGILQVQVLNHWTQPSAMTLLTFGIPKETIVLCPADGGFDELIERLAEFEGENTLVVETGSAAAKSFERISRLSDQQHQRAQNLSSRDGNLA